MIHRLETGFRALRRGLGRSALTVRLFAHVRRGTAAARRATDNAVAAPGTTGPHRRGLVVVQIDGLSHAELERALARGDMPTLARLRSREHYRLHRLYSGLPSSTPAVQGELFYGVAAAVPAFAWRERGSGELRRMIDPDSAKTIERELRAAGEAPLLAGGSAYCDIYTGGADEAHFCAASLGWSDVLKDARPHAWAAVALLHLPTLLRTAALAALESVLAIGEAIGGIARGYRAGPELKFVAARVAIVVLLRDLITIGAKVDIARGLPIVHLNFIGYDEQAHRRGPDTPFAYRALAGIDRRIGALWTAMHLAEHRHYDLWIYGDHGQLPTVPYVRRTGRTIEAAVAAVLRDEATDGVRRCAVDVTSGEGGERHGRASLLGGTRLQRLFPDDDEPSIAPADAGGPIGASVVAMGPVGHVLLGGEARPDERTLDRLAARLTREAEVPAVLFVDDDGAVVARTRDARLALPAAAETLLGAAHPALPDIVDDLVALARHARAGDLVLLGWAQGAEALSFAVENGAHAGIAPGETLSFALLPDDALPSLPNDTLAPRDESAALRPRTLRRAALHLLGRSGDDERRSTSRRAASASARGRRRLRVMSYNVHGCVGMDGRLAPERIARVIARQAPDVVALQELDVGRRRSGGRDQAHVIAALLEMDHRFHAAIHVEEEKYGDAILTRLPVLAHRSGLLPGPGGRRRRVEPRGALWVTLDVDGCAVQVINTHLGLLADERRAQVAALLSTRWLAHPDCTGPTILCGDLNATPRSPPLKRLGESFVDARAAVPGPNRGATFPTRGPTLAIDHVLVRGDVRVERTDVPRSELDRLASDHLPLVVDLSLEVEGTVRSPT